MNFQQAAANAPTWTAKFQAHHAIPISMQNEFLWLQQMAQFGFDIDGFEHNGMYLPTNQADALASGRAMHTSDHQQSYFNYVRTILMGMEREFLADIPIDRRHMGDAEYAARVQSMTSVAVKLSAHLRGGLIQQRINPDAVIPDGQHFDPATQMKLQIAVGGLDNQRNHHNAPFNEAQVLNMQVTANAAPQQRYTEFHGQYDKNGGTTIYQSFKNSRVFTDVGYYNKINALNIGESDKLRLADGYNSVKNGSKYDFVMEQARLLDANLHVRYGAATGDGNSDNDGVRKSFRPGGGLIGLIVAVLGYVGTAGKAYAWAEEEIEGGRSARDVAAELIGRITVEDVAEVALQKRGQSRFSRVRAASDVIH